MIFQTERLLLRKLCQADYPALCKILQDEQVMYAYEGVFNDNETQAWLEKQIQRYDDDGFGLWAVILKETNQMIGQCGLTLQEYNDEKVIEVGYLFQKKFWNKGYATEAATACKIYAFDYLGANEIFTIIRDTNVASQNVAKRIGMKKVGCMTKYFRGLEMPHFVFSTKV